MIKFNTHVKFISTISILSFGFFQSMAHADGLTIDKVYHPYVQPLEREIEFRWLEYDSKTAGDKHIYRLGYGQAVSSDWFLELYVIGGVKTNDFDADAYELEAIWQLTEQGEYDADWGLLFELEKETNQEIWEGSTAVLVEKEMGRVVSTANLKLSIEAGSDIKSEVETSAAFQLRYRYRRFLEPAIEFYVSQDTRGIGPVLLGEHGFGTGKKLMWEFGVIAGITDETPDTTVKASLEFEF